MTIFALDISWILSHRLWLKLPNETKMLNAEWETLK
jgi:hypothetical protein